MSHARQQIREAVAAAVTGLATTGTSVKQSRIYPLDDAKLPGLAVFTTEEAVDDEQSSISSGGITQTRNLDVVVEGYAKINDTLDDTLDTIAAEVETAIHADLTLGGLVKHIELTGTDITLAGEGEKMAGVVKLTFDAMYRVNITDPTTIVS